MKRLSAPRYDLFKFLVSIVLLGILLLMLARGCATIPAGAPAADTEPAINPLQTSTSVASAIQSTATTEPVTSSAVASSTPTNVSASPTAVAASATPTTPLTQSPDSTTTPAPTMASSTATAATSGGEACNTSVESRLGVGEEAQVVQRLNMRATASIDAPILRTNPTGTQVELIGGPVCTPVGERAYLWWQIRLADGTEGWSAEARLNDPSYLLQPIP